MSDLIDVVLHIDKHLLQFIRDYGGWVYGLLFGIVFAETGLVVTPFLPGDSLLFATGAVAATGALSLPAVIGLLALAAFAGNATNYAIGRTIGARVLTGRLGRLVNRRYLDRAHAFFEQHGGKAVILSRFVPILRTFVPFVAGAAEMSPRMFGLCNLAGAVGWVVLCTGAGWLFGNVPVVKEHFSLVTIGIVLVSLIPVAVEYLRHRRQGVKP